MLVVSVVCGFAFGAVALEPPLLIVEIPSQGRLGASAAVITGDFSLVHTAQILPLDGKGNLVGPGDASRQIEQVFTNLMTAVRSQTRSVPRLVKINVYVAEEKQARKVDEFLFQTFSVMARSSPLSKTITSPAVSVVVSALPVTGCLVAMDAVAAIPVETHAASASRAYVAALGGDAAMAHVSVLPPPGVVYISAQGVKGGLLEATAGTLKQLQETLTFLGLKKNDVVQCKAFVESMQGVATVQQQFKTFFAENGSSVPPVVFVEGANPGFPLVIETIAASQNSNAVETIEYLTPPGMTTSPLYSKVVRVNRGKLVYFSALHGNASLKPETEIEESFSLWKGIARKAGTDVKHLVKATYYFSTEEAGLKLNKLRPRFVDAKRPPATSKALVKSVGVDGKTFTLDMIGVVP